MEIWVVRSGYENKYANVFLSEGVIAIDYNGLENMSHINDIGDLRSLYTKNFANKTEWKARIDFHVNQIWRFLTEMKSNDFVLLPLKSGFVWLGRIESKYYYNKEEPFHRRKVKWIKEIEKRSLDRDLYHSLGAILSIYKMQKKNVNDRILKAFGLNEEQERLLTKSK